MAVYRFVVTPKWIGFAVLMIAASAVMVGLGFWQLDRYHTRHAINTRIDHANATAPVALSSVLSLGQTLPGDREWTRVSATGVYDAGATVVARDRTVNGVVGFEILTPLVLSDGSRLIVDRGWIPTRSGSADTPPPVPPAPTGEVKVEGRVHLPESSPDTPRVINRVPTVRRVAPAKLGMSRTYVDYLLLDKQTPKLATSFTRIPADRQPSWLNAGYTVQWWAFSILALIGLGWAIRREANDRRLGIDRAAQRRKNDDRPRDRLSRDRLGEDPAGGAPPPAKAVKSK